MLSISCCFVRNGGNFSQSDPRAKIFLWVAGEGLYALLALLCLLTRARGECLLCFAYSRLLLKSGAFDSGLIRAERRQHFPIRSASSGFSLGGGRCLYALLALLCLLTRDVYAFLALLCLLTRELYALLALMCLLTSARGGCLLCFY